MVGLCVLAFSVARLSLKLLFGLLFLPIRALTWLVVLPVIWSKAMFGLLAAVVFLPLIGIAGLAGCVCSSRCR